MKCAGIYFHHLLYYDEYVQEMLNKPNVRPVFEKYYSVCGKYPPFFLDFHGTDEELIKKVVNLTHRTRELLKRKIKAITRGYVVII